MCDRSLLSLASYLEAFLAKPSSVRVIEALGRELSWRQAVEELSLVGKWQPPFNKEN